MQSSDAIAYQYHQIYLNALYKIPNLKEEKGTKHQSKNIRIPSTGCVDHCKGQDIDSFTICGWLWYCLTVLSNSLSTYKCMCLLLKLQTLPEQECQIMYLALSQKGLLIAEKATRMTEISFESLIRHNCVCRSYISMHTQICAQQDRQIGRIDISRTKSSKRQVFCR